MAICSRCKKDTRSCSCSSNRRSSSDFDYVTPIVISTIIDSGSSGGWDCGCGGCD